MPARAGRGTPRPGTEAGQLVENIPRRMKVGVVETVEVRIAREGVADVGRGLQGSGAPQTHQLLITRAMSVRLQGEPGRFYIEPKSPETQWTGTRPDQLASDYAVWRFTVIPQVRGPAELTLIVASRSIGADGVIADTSLPEQRITIRVSANVTRGLKRWAGWVAVAVFGGVLAKLGEGFWEQLWTLARHALSI
jgi:neural Wiskott-Aldrich syndrome protein